jgi:hypothetical protein
MMFPIFELFTAPTTFPVKANSQLIVVRPNKMKEYRSAFVSNVPRFHPQIISALGRLKKTTSQL